MVNELLVGTPEDDADEEYFCFFAHALSVQFVDGTQRSAEPATIPVSLVYSYRVRD